MAAEPLKVCLWCGFTGYQQRRCCPDPDWRTLDSLRADSVLVAALREAAGPIDALSRYVYHSGRVEHVARDDAMKKIRAVLRLLAGQEDER